jgi:hypothetical protein
VLDDCQGDGLYVITHNPGVSLEDHRAVSAAPIGDREQTIGHMRPAQATFACFLHGIEKVWQEIEGASHQDEAELERLFAAIDQRDLENLGAWSLAKPFLQDVGQVQGRWGLEDIRVGTAVQEQASVTHGGPRDADHLAKRGREDPAHGGTEVGRQGLPTCA